MSAIRHRLPPDATWRPEYYFIATVVQTPRYINSVSRPHQLFANEELFTVWRMIEQAINMRGKEDPLLETVTFEEVTCTAEFQRNNHVDVRGLWDGLRDPTIEGKPERFHELLQLYAGIRGIDRSVCDRLFQLSEGAASPEETLTHLQSDIVGVNGTGRYHATSIRKLVQNLWEERDDKPRAKIHTGFQKLDQVIGALVPGCTYLWAARTSHGKSSWAAQVVSHQAMAGHRVGVVGLEDSPSVWASRWMARVSGVPLRKIRDQVLSKSAYDTDPISEAEEVALASTTQAAYLDNIHLTDAKGARIIDIIRIMNDLVVRHKCEIIWIDYLQAIYSERGDGRSRRDFLEYCWAMLEKEAERLEVPLMLTAQLNREWEREPLPTMPGLRHVEWLGAAEQKAFVGAVIYRPYRDPRNSQTQQNAQFSDLVVNIEKCKQGENVALQYSFDPAACCIKEK